MVTKIKNAVLVSDRLMRDAYLYIEDDKIVSVTRDELSCDAVIDAEGQYVSPGFIDIHTHGAGGFDYADGSVEDILRAAHAHAKGGVTTVFPTSPSLSVEDTERFVVNVREAMKQNAPGRPYIAGSHLEGPYFADAQRGAQNPAYIKAPAYEEYAKWIALGEGTVKRMSFAPELVGTSALCDYLNENGIVSAFAHTDGIYEEIKPLIDKGCRIATHLYSGMNTVTRRHMQRKLGAVETAFLEDDVVVEVIADGVHLPVELLRLIYRIKGEDRIALVTDSMRGEGMESGFYTLGPKRDGMSCFVQKDDVAYLPDRTAFAGSVASAARLVRTMYHGVGVPLPSVIKMMCETPARAMKLEKRGKLASDFYADLVFFDENVNVSRVLIEGKELLE